MKKEEIKKKTYEELRTAVKEAKEKLSALRFGRTGGKSKNVKESSTLKKSVARMLTELRLKK